MVVAVVLTFEPPDGLLEACVSSVLAAGGAERVVVVDNGGRARTRLAAAGIDDSRLEVVETGRNLGYTGGMNVGITRALALGASAVALLNDDVEVDAGWLQPLVAALDADALLGAVQPKVLEHGAAPARVASMGVALGRDGAGTDLAAGALDGPDHGADVDVEACTGAAVLVRADLLCEVGGFDERYFLYYEDVDLALRAAARGWRFRCVAASTVRHHGSATAHTGGEIATRTAYLRERNRLWVLARHRPLGDNARGWWLSVRRLRWPPRRLHARALVAGAAAVPRLVLTRLRG